jgi:hypothetical protein
MNNYILIYTPLYSPRAFYAFKLIFQSVLDCEYRVTHKKEELTSYTGVKINYSTDFIENTLQIIPHSIVQEQGIYPHNIDVSKWGNNIVFFKTSTGNIPFDIFAASFYLASRYEEYLPNELDNHGRFIAENSLAFKHNFLKEPIINQWALLLKYEILSSFPDFVFTKKQFTFIPTVDVDIAFAYLGRNFIRTFLAYCKAILHFNYKSFIERNKVLLHLKQDPYDTFGLIHLLHKKYNLKPVYFFLLGKNSKYDKNTNPGKKCFKRLVQQQKNVAQIGIHPSYLSNTIADRLQFEINTLKKIIGERVISSRQHFLKMQLPNTYQSLIKEGILNDFTMGYATQTGFRAGICNPYYFYNLCEEKETTLVIHPFAVMDGTLNEYIMLNPDDAISEIKLLIDNVKKVNGTFISLWHNVSFSETGIWYDWQKVYSTMLEYANN